MFAGPLILKLALLTTLLTGLVLPALLLATLLTGFVLPTLLLLATLLTTLVLLATLIVLVLVIWIWIVHGLSFHFEFPMTESTGGRALRSACHLTHQFRRCRPYLRCFHWPYGRKERVQRTEQIERHSHGQLICLLTSLTFGPSRFRIRIPKFLARGECLRKIACNAAHFQIDARPRER